ncbi:MAG TPA: hypothetical protein VK399_05655 [Longimicrobiaceae bacterium]|nr:hypothetical protein [Longimicrobiaceae bacterium]
MNVQRLPDCFQVETDLDAWEKQCNSAHARLAWRFTIERARTRLAALSRVAVMNFVAIY